LELSILVRIQARQQVEKGTDFIGVSIVYFCHDGNGNVVLVKRSNNARDEFGKWDIGGGGLELNDSVVKRLKKEIKEEYCTIVLDYEFLGYRDVHRKQDSKPTHWITLDFKVLIDPKLVKNGEPHKFEEVKMFKLDQLPSPLHSQLPNFIKKYKAKICNL
jgi:8-oxo-dGTP diphosphatase